MPGRPPTRPLAGPLTGDSAEIRSLLGLLRTAARVNDHIGNYLKSRGISQQQYTVLRILGRAGSEGLAASAIGDRMVQRLPDVTRLLDRLEAAGKVRRSRSQEDRRVVRVTITAAARREIEALEAPVRALAEEVLGGMDPLERQQLDRLLGDVRERIDALPRR
ncbi:MAG: MarR family transcriptional regulator [Planctomycetes bacterium]|nr:MarR family transcriptional regulator [Planctomycetota bacterium]